MRAFDQIALFIDTAQAKQKNLCCNIWFILD